MKNKILPLAVLVIGVAVMLVPLANHAHIYQTLTESSDIKAHSEMVRIIADNQQLGVNIYPMMYIQRGALSKFGDIASSGQGQKGVILYPAQYLFGWVFGQADKVLHVNPQTVMLWFMFLTLAGVALTLYVFGRMINDSGWLLLLIPLLCTTAILGLFAYGVVYSIFNMYIVLLWAILFMVKGLETRKIKWFTAGTVAFVLFLVLHPMPISPYVAVGNHAGLPLNFITSPRQSATTTAVIAAASDMILSGRDVRRSALPPSRTIAKEPMSNNAFWKFLLKWTSPRKFHNAHAVSSPSAVVTGEM